MARQVAVASQELLAAPHCLLERKVFKAMERFVVHERPHRPILRDDLACEMDHPSQLHSPRFDVGSVLYLSHTNNSVMAPVAVVSVPVSNRWVGTTPKASNTTTRIESEANSPGSRSV